MSTGNTRMRLIALAGLLSWALASQGAVFEETGLISTGAAPVERTVTLAAAGDYQITLTDLQFPAAMSDLRVAVTRGAALVGRLDQAGTGSFTLSSPGEVVVRVTGRPAAGQVAGSFGIDLRRVGEAVPSLEFTGAIASPGQGPVDGREVFASRFEVSVAGSHECSLADAGLPATLADVALVITRAGALVCSLGGGRPLTGTFNATPGEYEVFADATALASAGAGLFTVRVTRAAATVFAAAVPVGELALPTRVDLPSAGAHTLSLVDQAFPAPLAALGAVVIRDGMVLASQTGGGVAPFSASTGPVDVFQAASTTNPSGGAYGITVAGPQGQLYAEVVPVSGPTGGPPAPPVYQFQATLPAAGTYRVSVTDFDFLSPFAALDVAVSQGGSLLGVMGGGDSLEVDATAGRLVVSVAPELAVANARSLFGVVVVDATSGAVLLEATQGVGASFEARQFTISTAGSYDATLADLGFHAPFAELNLALTRGVQRLGLVFGAGSFSFDATPGTYYLNFIAAPGATADTGLFGIVVDPTPPPPVVSLTASPLSVTSGASTQLNWSSSDATSCSASGGWSGSKALSGSETRSGIVADTTFVLSCSGAGGSSQATVSVTVRAPSSGGGGGAVGATSLVLLALLAAGRVLMGSARRLRPRRGTPRVPLHPAGC